MSTETVVEATCQAIIGGFFMLLLIILLSKLYTTTFDERVKKVTYIPIAYFLTGSVGWSLWSIRLFLYGQYTGHSKHNIAESTIAIISFCCLSTAIILSYLFMLFQLKQSFSDTIFKVTKCVSYSHNIILIVCVLMGIVSAYFYIIVDNVLLQFSLMILILFWASGFFHIAWSFNRKLYKLLDERQKQNAQRRKSYSHCHGQEDLRQLKILHIIVKVTVLILNNMLASIVFFIFMVLSFSIGGIIGAILYWGICTIYWMSISLYIFLILQINDDMYGVLCKGCHARFEKFCDGLIKKPNEMTEIQSNSGSPSRGTVTIGAISDGLRPAKSLSTTNTNIVNDLENQTDLTAKSTSKTPSL